MWTEECNVYFFPRWVQHSAAGVASSPVMAPHCHTVCTGVSCCAAIYSYKVKSLHGHKVICILLMPAEKRAHIKAVESHIRFPFPRQCFFHAGRGRIRLTLLLTLYMIFNCLRCHNERNQLFWEKSEYLEWYLKFSLVLLTVMKLQTF